MKSIAVAFVLLFTVSLATAAVEKTIHPYLYRVTAGGHTSWLIGTIHTSFVSIEDFHPSLKDAVVNANSILAEGIGGQGFSLSQILKGFIRPGAVPLRKRLSPGAWQRLQSWIRHSQPPEQQKAMLDIFNQIPPGATLLALMNFQASARLAESQTSVPLGPFADMDTDEKIFDEQLYRLAAEVKKNVIRLDASDFLFQLYGENAPVDALSQFIMIHINSSGHFVSLSDLGINEDERTEDFKKASESYAKGTLDFQDYLHAPVEVDTMGPLMSTRKKIETELSPARHKDWFPQILDSIKRRSTTVIAGVGHIANPEHGLVKLLREQPGVVVTPASELFSVPSRPHSDPCPDILE